MTIIHGDCLAEMRKMDANSITGIFTDPPYGLSFMNKEWDHGIPGVPFWLEMYRISKPGAYLLAFGGTRTFHRMACAIEDAGWEIRDCISWLYGSGFPKSLNISKAIDKAKGCEREVIGIKSDPRYLSPRNNSPNHMDREAGIPGGHGKDCLAAQITSSTSDLAKQFDGYGTALKPAWEPVIVAMKPCDGTFAQNAEKWGQAGINIAACRVEASDQSALAKNWNRSTVTDMRSGNYGNGTASGIELSTSAPIGRWPANLILDGEEAGKMLDEQSGNRKSSIYNNSKGDTNGFHDCLGREHKQRSDVGGFNDSGGASRFFYCAKASSAERGEGNVHPCVKPLKLMEYLITLIAPPRDAIILDPFMGSGTTLLAAHNLGINCIGIEQSADYCEIARNRLEGSRDLFTASNK